MEKIGLCFRVYLALFVIIDVGASNKRDSINHHSFDLLQEENVKTHFAKQFRRQPGLHVRHNLEFQLALQLHEQCDKPFVFKLIENENCVFSWTQIPIVKDDGRHHFELRVNRSIPVGQYKLIAADDDPCLNEKKAVYITDINVMFNPLTVEFDEHHSKFRRQTINNVFMTEYINNNCGYIWTGPVAIPWSYAVGSTAVTESREALIQLMTQSERINQVLYTRALTRLIGSQVLLGRWNGDYRGGFEPTRWVGSEDILQRWLRSRSSRVRYGQCWVFVFGILNDVRRIPPLMD